jgi:hypothetical protein
MLDSVPEDLQGKTQFDIGLFKATVELFDQMHMGEQMTSNPCCGIPIPVSEDEIDHDDEDKPTSWCGLQAYVNQKTKEAHDAYVNADSREEGREHLGAFKAYNEINEKIKWIIFQEGRGRLFP